MANSPLRGRVAVVTGAARGIGAELAGQLTDRGARVALLGLEPRELAAVAGRCGPGAAWWEVDVTDPAGLAAAAAGVADRFGPAEVVVANAGIGIAGSLLVADPASFDRVIEVNLLGSVRTARAFLPQLVHSRGYLLQIASLAALTPMPLGAPYGASKAGVESFAHSIRIELAPHGVGVGVAYLSWTDTDLVRGVDAAPGMAAGRAGLPFPFNRTYPVAAAVARLVAGIERRAAHVYAPAWVAAVAPIRGLLPALAARAAGRHVAEGETALRAAGPASTLPVGPGGRADHQRRAGGSPRSGGPATFGGTGGGERAGRDRRGEDAVMVSDPRENTEADVPADKATARTRATGGDPDPDAPDQASTTGTTPSDTFVGRVTGDESGDTEETGAEARARQHRPS